MASSSVAEPVPIPAPQQLQTQTHVAMSAFSEPLPNNTSNPFSAENISFEELCDRAVAFQERVRALPSSNKTPAQLAREDRKAQARAVAASRAIAAKNGAKGRMVYGRGSNRPQA
jgi:hypothetical protein